ELSAAMLQEVLWPSQSVPSGAFAKIGDVLKAGRRVVLTAIEPNEPVLALKITGAGERATLSALVHEGMKAVTIRVNDVDGVGGFVLPGDRVDVVMTRQLEKGSAVSEVVLQNTRVLAIDQNADERAGKASVAKSVTLEVPTEEASHTFCACTVETSSVTDLATDALPARSSAFWSIASTRVFCNTTSETAEPFSSWRVITTSTR